MNQRQQQQDQNNDKVNQIDLTFCYEAIVILDEVNILSKRQLKNLNVWKNSHHQAQQTRCLFQSDNKSTN